MYPLVLGTVVLALSVLSDTVSAGNLPRQTTQYSNTTSSGGSNPVSLSRTPTGSAVTGVITPPPCCWIFGGEQAVDVNYWWTNTANETIATVITTYLQYHDTFVVANSTTLYKPKNETFSSYGPWGANFNQYSPSGLTGVPTDLIPSQVLGAGQYGETLVVRANETATTFSGTAIANGTPYQDWHEIGVFTCTPKLTQNPKTPITTYDAEMCGTRRVSTYNAYISGTWTHTTRHFVMPTCGGIDGYDFGQHMEDPQDYSFVTTMPASPPTSVVYMDMPTNLRASMAKDPSVLKTWPYIANCWTVGGQGQPTVHVPVAQVTSTSSHVITMNGPFSAAAGPASSSSTASTQSVQSALPAVQQTSVTQQTSSVVIVAAPSKTASPSQDTTENAVDVSTVPTTQNEQPQASRSTAEAATPAETVPTTAVQPSADASRMLSVLTGLAGGETHSQQQSEQGVTVTDARTATVNAADGLSSDAVAAQTVSVQAANLTETASSAVVINAQTAPSQAGPDAISSGYVIASQTALPGGPAITEQDVTYTGLSSNAGLQVASKGQTTVAEGAKLTSLAISAGATILPVASSTASPNMPKIVTLGSETLSCEPLGTTAAVVGSNTLAVGGPAATQGSHTILLVAGTGGLGIALNEQTTMPLPASLTAATGQLIAVGDTSFTAYTAASSAIVVGGQTLSPSAAAVIDGQTVSRSGNNLIVGSNTVAITQGAPAPSPGTQLITVGSSVFTAYAAAPSRIVVAGQTLAPGVVTEVGGQTLSANGNSLMVFGEASTATYAFVASTPVPITKVVTIGGHVYTAFPVGSSGVIVVGQTISPGQATVLNGETVSASGNSLIVFGGTLTATYAFVASTPVPITGAIIIGGQVYTAYQAGSSGVVVAGQTISPGHATVLNGETLSASGNDLIVASGTVTSTVVFAASSSTAQLVTVGGQVYTAFPARTSGVIIAGQTISPGQATVLNGEALSVSGSNLIMASGTLTSTVALAASSESAQLVTVGGQVYTAFQAGSSGAVINGQTIAPGIETVINGEIVSVSGNDLIMASGTVTSTVALAMAPANAQLVTIGSQVYTASLAASSGVVIAGQTLYPGTTAVIAGETVQVSGTNLIVVSGTATTTEGLDGAIISGIGGGTSTASVEPFTGAGNRLHVPWLVSFMSSARLMR